MFTDKLTLAIAEAAKKCMDEELKGNQHKIDANKNGKIDAQDFKILRKEETVNEEEGKYGYVAFSHDGKRHELYANTSYEAKQKAVKHFNPPKSKQHLVTVHLAQKDGKDVVHTATESVQEAAIDDLRDRQAAAREANPYGSKDKKEPVARKIQGSQYGGTKQKHEPEKEDLSEDGKKYKEMNGIGKAKYTVSHHDGEQKHKDGSPFYGIKTFKNKVEKDKFVKDLHSKGYVKEEVEQIDELSKDTLKSYREKASVDMFSNAGKAIGAIANKDKEKETEYRAKWEKRIRGVNAVDKKLKKEEVEQIDESKAHIEQHLADKDINAKVTDKTVQVHSSDVAAAKKHVAKAGYKDHKVVGGLNEEKMSDEDMAQRERIVKGMKKNLKGFKQRYGERAKEVMYATATKQAMKEETLDEQVTEGQPGKHKPSAYEYVGKHSDGGHIFKNDEGKKEVFHKVKSPASWYLQHKGASYEFAHSLKEEVEQIDEISKDTLNSYVKKAEADKKDSVDRYNAYDRDAQGKKISDRDRSPARRAIDNLLSKRVDKRVAGLKTANAKLAKEETEKKSDSDKWKEAYKQAKQSGSSTANARARANGAVREEVTNDGFKAELEDNKAKAAGTKKQPDVAKAAVQSVKQESFSQKLSSLKESARSFLKGMKDE